MKPQGNGKQAREKTSRTNREHAYSSGLDLETKIFSASGRGGAFFLTSLFIELIDSKQRLSQAGKVAKMNRPLIGALLCIAGLLLELGLFLKHRVWGGYQPDGPLALGLIVALLVNLYLLRGKRAVSK